MMRRTTARGKVTGTWVEGKEGKRKEKERADDDRRDRKRRGGEVSMTPASTAPRG